MIPFWGSHWNFHGANMFPYAQARPGLPGIYAHSNPVQLNPQLPLSARLQEVSCCPCIIKNLRQGQPICVISPFGSFVLSPYHPSINPALVPTKKKKKKNLKQIPMKTFIPRTPLLSSSLLSGTLPDEFQPHWPPALLTSASSAQQSHFSWSPSSCNLVWKYP